MTQESLGFGAGLQRKYISMLELGEIQPTLTTVFKLASALGVKASDLIALVEAKLPANKRGR